jgi:hypothetical protein
VGVAGCGGQNDAAGKVDVFPVSGKVVLPDGKPLQSGRIVFVSKDGMSSSTGKIGEDGTFTLTTGVSGEGAPAGEYKIRLEPDETKLKAVPKGSRPGAALPFPGKYTDESTSELTATITSGTNQLAPFKLVNQPLVSQSSRVVND